MNELNLLENYVSSFGKLDELTNSTVPQELVIGEDEYGFKRWEPIKVETDPNELKKLYKEMNIKFRFPPIYEKLILNYRWAEVDLGSYRLIANLPGDGLESFGKELRRDKVLWGSLITNGYFQFGKGPGVNYDPVCFDFNSGGGSRECRIVQLDHEEILCDNRIEEVKVLAKSFRELIIDTINRDNNLD